MSDSEFNKEKGLPVFPPIPSQDLEESEDEPKKEIPLPPPLPSSRPPSTRLRQRKTYSERLQDGEFENDNLDEDNSDLYRPPTRKMSSNSLFNLILTLTSTSHLLAPSKITAVMIGLAFFWVYLYSRKMIDRSRSTRRLMWLAKWFILLINLVKTVFIILHLFSFGLDWCRVLL